jgi:hypothetical protein
MFAFMAFSENQIGEFFCNGIPFTELNGNQIEYGTPVSYDSAFRRATNHADSALASVTGPDSARIRQLAAVIKGRALLNRNQPAAAAAAVAAVATSFQYLSTHSVNATDNVLWLQSVSLRRLVMGDNEGTNGLDFERQRSAHSTFAVGIPSTTLRRRLGRPPERAHRPVIIASGIEARLIGRRPRSGPLTSGFWPLTTRGPAGLDLRTPGTTAARETLPRTGLLAVQHGYRLGDSAG